MQEAINEQSEVLLINQDTMHGMYLTFDLAGEGYGLEIRYVTEIIGIQNVGNVPDMPAYVIGVLNLRGKVIPIIDMRLRFNLPSREYDERTCIVVIKINENPVGLVVDQVREVVDIADTDIEPPPAVGGDGCGNFIKGLGKMEGEVKILLNIEAMITDDGLDTANVENADTE